MGRWKKTRYAATVTVAAMLCAGAQSGVLAAEGQNTALETEVRTEKSTADDERQETQTKSAEAEKTAKKLKITNEYSFAVQRVSGLGEAASNLTRGGRFNDMLNFEWENRMEREALSGSVGINVSNDRGSDPKSVNLTNFMLHYENHRHNATLGDVMGSFSNYTMSAAAKGISYKYQDEEKNGPEVSLIHGIQYARWDNFWDRDPLTQSTPRVISGVRLRQRIGDELLFGVNYAQADDAWRLTSFSVLNHSKVWGADFEYRPSPFWLYSGEYARSTARESAYQDAADMFKSGDALRFSAVLEKGKTRFSTEYERVAPFFESKTGSAGADREKLKIAWKDRLGLGSTYHTMVYWDRDNLDRRLETTTQNINYEIGVSFQQAFGRESAVADLSLIRNRNHDTDQTNTLEKTLNLSYRDTFSGVDADISTGYSRSDYATNATQYNWTYNLNLSKNIQRGETSITPTLTIAHNKQAASDCSSRVMAKSYAMGVAISFANGESLNLTTGWKRADHYGQSDNLNNWFGNMNWVFKPTLLKALGVTSAFLKIGINDYRYDGNENRNYRENSTMIGIKSEF